MEAACHDTVSRVECLFDAIAMVDIDVDVEASVIVVAIDTFESRRRFCGRGFFIVCILGVMVPVSIRV